MDTRTGEIHTVSQLKEIFKGNTMTVEDLFARRFDSLKGDARFYRPMEAAPTEKQMSRRPPKVGRNEPCPCGRKDENGKPIKFKKCCLNSIK
jgi:uncharacterized protein YecA (UPF0149 family)